MFTYESETQGDLRFSEGETVLVYWADENGWWFGSASSAQGWFPGSYVEVRMELFVDSTCGGVCWYCSLTPIYFDNFALRLAKLKKIKGKLGLILK